MCFKFEFINVWQNLIGLKAAHKMLLKLTKEKADEVKKHEFKASFSFFLFKVRKQLKSNYVL